MGSPDFSLVSGPQTCALRAKYIYAPSFGVIAVAAYAIRRANGAAGQRYAQLLLIS